MIRPSVTYTNDKGHEITLTWIRDNNLAKYQPCTQAYGVVFNNKGEILLIQFKNRWQIPGGTPEPGETPEEALHRELMEEADVTVKDVLSLGVQQVSYPDSPKTDQGRTFYQYRYICRLDQLHDSTPDPASGITHPRKFVPAQEVTHHVDWGTIGEGLFADALKLYENKLAKGK